MVGPRFTVGTNQLHVRKVEQHNARIFGEALLGGARAFNSAFPGSSSVVSTATAFSMQLGGGIDVTLAHGFGFRAFELDYIHTTFSDNAANSQNDFHVATGFSYRR